MMRTWTSQDLSSQYTYQFLRMVQCHEDCQITEDDHQKNGASISQGGWLWGLLSQVVPDLGKEVRIVSLKTSLEIKNALASVVAIPTSLITKPFPFAICIWWKQRDQSLGLFAYFCHLLPKDVCLVGFKRKHINRYIYCWQNCRQ